MQDRISTYQGRVTLTPVSGQVNTYDMVRADSPEQTGTPLNTETLLSQRASSTILTLAGVEPENPSEAFIQLSKVLYPLKKEAVAIEHGSYIGTGTSGDFLTINVPFEPLCVILVNTQNRPGSDSNHALWELVMLRDVTKSRVAGVVTHNINVTWDDYSVILSDDDAGNTSGPNQINTVYRWVCIGQIPDGGVIDEDEIDWEVAVLELIDPTLTLSDHAADAKAVGDAIDAVRDDITDEAATRQAADDALSNKKANLPADNDYGASGQILRSTGTGTEWADVGQPTDEQTARAVRTWLDDHPEATTTVQDSSLTEAKFTDDLKLKTVKDYVTPEMFGAVGDGVTDDTEAFKSAIASDKNVFVPNGTYYLTETLVLPLNAVLFGENREKAILTFASGTNGIQFVGRNTVKSLKIITSGNASTFYAYSPDSATYNMNVIVDDIHADHESNDATGSLIEIVAESVTNKHEGFYSFAFSNIRVEHAIQYGIQLLNKAKTTSTGECWITDAKFENIFFDGVEVAFQSDWEDVSNSNAVPHTGYAPKNSAITLKNVSAEYRANITECFANIQNATDVNFIDCFPFDYFYLISLSTPKTFYKFNAYENMCRVNLGTQLEVSDVTGDVSRYIEFSNNTGTFDDALRTVVLHMMLTPTGRTYGNFRTPIKIKADDDVFTVSLAGASGATITGIKRGDIALVNIMLTGCSLSAGSNLLGKFTSDFKLAYGYMQVAGTIGSGNSRQLVQIVLNTSREVRAVVDSAVSGSIRFSTVIIC